MRVARLHASGQLLLHDEPEPIPGSGQTLVRVHAVGVCGSDLHWFTSAGIGDTRLEHPLVLGHESSGVTQDGVRVAVDPAIPCGLCEWCRRGDPNLCPEMSFAGHGAQDGALREVMAWPRHCLQPLPDTVSDEAGAMLEPLGVALHAVDLAGIRLGMSVGVFGCGPIGLLIVQLARRAGARQILATDALPHRVDAARMAGADLAILAENGREQPELISATGGRGVDVAIEVAGEQAAADTAFAAVCPGGKVILAGIPGDDRTSFSASTARRKGLTIKLVRRMKHTYPRAIDLAARRQIDLESLITHRYPLEQVASAFEAANWREGLKIMVEM